jgi:D-3-phosphoglycerate dehydrogenase
MKKVLIADKLPQECMDILEDAGFETENNPGLSPDELKKALAGVNGVICRSGAKLSEDVLEGADQLEAICRAGVGVDNIDIMAASRRGAVVMNTPGANTISTAEHAFALMMALARNIGPAYVSMREARWDKKKYKGSQLSGATLGVVGLGRVGQAVAKRALAFGMNVVGHDPYISRDTAQKLGVEMVDDLPDLLEHADYLTVHVPENENTYHMIGEDEIAKMKDGARIVNCARGGVVNQEAVEKAVEEGKLAGAAFDVYPEEPPEDFSFSQSDAILATPHLGASTDEAQLAVAKQAATQMVDALKHQEFSNALNVTVVAREEMEFLKPYCDLAHRLGKAVAQLNRGRPDSIKINCKGGLADREIAPIKNYAVMGVLQTMLGSSVNMVSAPHLAEERGLKITTSSTSTLEAGFTDLLEINLVTEDGEMKVAGTVFGRKHPRIVAVGQFEVEMLPEGHVLMVFGRDKPGFIGYVGETLANAGINIARMGFGREEAGGNALVALNLDSACDKEVRESLLENELVSKAVLLSL